MDIIPLEKYLKSPLNNLVSGIGKEFQQVVSNRILEYQTEEFRRNSLVKTLLHRTKPVELEKIYQPLKIVEFKIYKKQKNQREYGHKINLDSIKSLFKDKSYISIIGAAGSGKSTITKHLLIRCIKESYKIPIKIELRYLNNSDKGFKDFVFENIFKYNKIGVSESIIERLLNKNLFVFFLDGYDEIKSSIKERLTLEINNFISRFNNNKFLITSRPYSNIELFPLFSNFEVLPFEEPEIIEFIKKQVPNEIAEKITHSIKQDSNNDYKSFLVNPLLLSMFILTFRTYSDLPSKKHVFYNQVFDALFYLHDSISKLNYKRERKSNLPKESIEEILKVFSFISFFEEKLFFNKNYINEKFSLIKKLEHVPIFNSIELINELTVSIGIFSKEGVEYFFPHKSLQEYFAALFVSTTDESNRKNLYDRLFTAIETKNSESIENFCYLLQELDEYNMKKYLIVRFLSEFDCVLNKLIKDYSKSYKECLAFIEKYKRSAFMVLCNTKRVHGDSNEFLTKIVHIRMSLVNYEAVLSGEIQKTTEDFKDKLEPILLKETNWLIEYCKKRIRILEKENTKTEQDNKWIIDMI